MSIFKEVHKQATVLDAADNIVEEVSGTSDLARRMNIIREATDPVLVQIESEGGSEIVSMFPHDAAQVRELLQSSDEWPEEVNDILNRARRLNVIGVVNTMGDGWGWYEPGDK